MDFFFKKVDYIGESPFSEGQQLWFIYNLLVIFWLPYRYNSLRSTLSYYLLFCFSLEDESRTIDKRATEIGWNLKQKIEDLLASMGIKRDTKIEKTLIKFLKSDDGIETAIDYLSRKVQTTQDVETLAALREHAFRTLTEVRKEMEIRVEVMIAQVTATILRFNFSDLKLFY